MKDEIQEASPSFKTFKIRKQEVKIWTLVVTWLLLPFSAL